MGMFFSGAAVMLLGILVGAAITMASNKKEDNAG